VAYGPRPATGGLWDAPHENYGYNNGIGAIESYSIISYIAME